MKEYRMAWWLGRFAGMLRVLAGDRQDIKEIIDEFDKEYNQ
jgi:hypothetical protein